MKENRVERAPYGGTSGVQASLLRGSKHQRLGRPFYNILFLGFIILNLVFVFFGICDFEFRICLCAILHYRGPGADSPRNIARGANRAGEEESS
jgi:hypothetical protein